ncbi:hypothetical protein G6F24_018582 [Rhizopus arrhizus]|nr:hypothetical protein G6F24_018582 [Rhizopus arrhizus]
MRTVPAPRPDAPPVTMNTLFAISMSLPPDQFKGMNAARRAPNVTRPSGRGGNASRPAGAEGLWAINAPISS